LARPRPIGSTPSKRTEPDGSLVTALLVAYYNVVARYYANARRFVRTGHTRRSSGCRSAVRSP